MTQLERPCVEIQYFLNVGIPNKSSLVMLISSKQKSKVKQANHDLKIATAIGI
jgi:hypothetical protein